MKNFVRAHPTLGGVTVWKAAEQAKVTKHSWVSMHGRWHGYLASKPASRTRPADSGNRSYDTFFFSKGLVVYHVMPYLDFKSLSCVGAVCRELRLFQLDNCSIDTMPWRGFLQLKHHDDSTVFLLHLRRLSVNSNASASGADAKRKFLVLIKRCIHKRAWLDRLPQGSLQKQLVLMNLSYEILRMMREVGIPAAAGK